MENYFPLRKSIAFVMAVFHLGAFAALFFPTWSRVALGFFVWATVSSFGIGVGYHRLLTHRGYKTYRWIEYTLAIIGALAQQGLAITWVAIHRVHHRYTEEPGRDPHTPRDGRWWSHLDWMLHPDPELRKRTDLRRWAPDLMRQPFYTWQYIQWLPTTALGLLCLIIGGIPGVLWGVALPVVVGWHQTWLVNSATHIWGKRRFNTRDDSRNLWWVALITWGEGWHNNHHEDPVSPRHGLAWYEVDVNWAIIYCLRVLRLVWDTKEKSPIA
jgi:stearoyl-CoA desaturase (delta-9 desaturase)